MVAGAEGLEPSARGFGVDVEKLANHITAGVFGGVEPFSNRHFHALKLFDALLMM